SGSASACFMRRNDALTSTFHASENDSQSNSSTGPIRGVTPAVSTTRSGLRSRRRRSTNAGSVASPWSVESPSPTFVSSARSLCALPATAVTRTPSEINALTVTLPTPELPPMTTALLPRRDVISLSISRWPAVFGRSALVVLIVATPPHAFFLIAALGSTVEPLVHAPEHVQPARIRGIGVVNGAVFKREPTPARPRTPVPRNLGV